MINITEITRFFSEMRDEDRFYFMETLLASCEFDRDGDVGVGLQNNAKAIAWERRNDSDDVLDAADAIYPQGWSTTEQLKNYTKAARHNIEVCAQQWNLKESLNA